jgi:hypothetical protein
MPGGGLREDIGERDNEGLPINLEGEIGGEEETIPGQNGLGSVEEVEREDCPRRHRVGGERGTLKAPAKLGKEGRADQLNEGCPARVPIPRNAHVAG